MKECSRCHKTKPLSEFYRNRRQPDGYAYHCKDCHRAFLRRPDQVARRKAYYQDYKKRDPERRKQTMRSGHLRRRYGITLEDFERMYEEQGGKCGLCLQEPEGTLCVDHDHETGKVRGLLCPPCNRLLHRIDSDWFQRAVLWTQQ